MRVNIYLPDELGARLARAEQVIRERAQERGVSVTLNVSAICQDALTEVVNRILSDEDGSAHDD